MKTALFYLTSLWLACGAQAVPPPADRLFFPIGLLYDKSTDRLYVSNENSDLAFNGATVVVLDRIKALDAEGMACRTAREAAAAAPSGCQISADGPPTLCAVDGAGHCNASEGRTPHILPDATKEIGSFPGNFAATPDGKRLFFAVRGDPSLSFVDTDGSQGGDGALRCETANQGEGIPPRCTGKNVLLADTPDPPDGLGMVVPGFQNGIFAVAIDMNRQLTKSETVSLLYVSHETGAVSLFRLESDLTPRYQQSRTVTAGATQIAVQPQTGIAYIARQRYIPEEGVVMGATLEMVIAQSGTDDASRLNLTALGSLLVPGFDNGSTDYHALSFSGDGKQLYVGISNPPSVVVLDTSLGPAGMPQNRVLARIPVSSAPEEISTVPLPAGGEMVYVTAMAGNFIHVIDPQHLDSATVTAVIHIDRPVRAAFGALGDARRLFVTSYEEGTLWAIDVDPGSPSFNQVLYRIGAPHPVKSKE